jgi:hypothetical protein
VEIIDRLFFVVVVLFSRSLNIAVDVVYVLRHIEGVERMQLLTKVMDLQRQGFVSIERRFFASCRRRQRQREVVEAISFRLFTKLISSPEIAIAEICIRGLTVFGRNLVFVSPRAFLELREVVP